MKLAVKVVPGSSKERIVGWLGDELKVRVREVAEGGKANQAVRRLLAGSLDLPLDDVHIASGSASPHKIIELAGMDEPTLRKRLAL